jgi:hypothetical protein
MGQLPPQRRAEAGMVHAASRTWELKSQYGHLDAQNGQWM